MSYELRQRSGASVHAGVPASESKDSSEVSKTKLNDALRWSKQRVLAQYLTVITFCIVSIGVLLITRFYHEWIPDPAPIDAPLWQFSEGRARTHMEAMCELGPRHTGNIANEVFAPMYILRQLAEIKTNLGKHLQMEISIQRPSGSFDLDFVNGFTSMYDGILNIVVRLSDTRYYVFNPQTNQREPGPAVMLSAHYDSAIGTPAASDNAANVANAIELLRLFATHPDGPYQNLFASATQTDQSKPLSNEDDMYDWNESNRLRHPLLFVFSGGEETILQAAHGLITQHPWGPTIRTFVNLDAAGGGGRELVFQTGPRCPSLAYAYMRSAPYPHATTIAQDLFQTGAVPSDTDFRIYKDFGGLPGLDMAYISNGYIYHTSLDTPDRFPAGAFQRTGDNLRALLRALDATPGLLDVAEGKESIYQKSAVSPTSKNGVNLEGSNVKVHPTTLSKEGRAAISIMAFGAAPLLTLPQLDGDPIFFDFLGLFGVIYSPLTAYVVHGLVVLMALIYLCLPLPLVHGPLIEYLQLSQKEFADGLGALAPEENHEQNQQVIRARKEELEKQILSKFPESLRGNSRVNNYVVCLVEHPITFALTTLIFGFLICFSFLIPALYGENTSVEHYFVVPGFVTLFYLWTLHILATRFHIVKRFVRLLTPKWNVFGIMLRTHIIGMGWVLMSIIVSILVCAGVSGLMWLLGARMVWFSEQRFLLGIYVPLTIITMLYIRDPSRILPKLDGQYLMSRSIRLDANQNAHDKGIGYPAAESISFSSALSLWVLILSLSWVYGVGSGYFPAIWVIFSLVGKVAVVDTLLPWVMGDGEEPVSLLDNKPSSLSAEDNEKRKNLLCVRIRPWKPYLRSILFWVSIMPATFVTAQLTLTLLSFFIPISGRAGQTIPTDIVVAVIVSALSAFGLLLPIVPLVSLTNRAKRSLIKVLSLVVLCSTLFAVLNGSTYTYERPKRLILQHIQRALSAPVLLKVNNPPEWMQNVEAEGETLIADYSKGTRSGEGVHFSVGGQEYSIGQNNLPQGAQFLSEAEATQVLWDETRKTFAAHGGGSSAFVVANQTNGLYSDSGIVIYALDSSKLSSFSNLYLPRVDVPLLNDLEKYKPRLGHPASKDDENSSPQTYSVPAHYMTKLRTGGFYGDLPIYLPYIEFVPEYLILPSPPPFVTLSPMETARLISRPVRSEEEIRKDGIIASPSLLGSMSPQTTVTRNSELPNYSEASMLNNLMLRSIQEDDPFSKDKAENLAKDLLKKPPKWNWEKMWMYDTHNPMKSIETNNLFKKLLLQAGLTDDVTNNARNAIVNMQKLTPLSVELMSSKWVSGSSLHFESYFPGRQSPSPRLRLSFRIRGPAQMTFYFSSAPESTDPAVLPRSVDNKYSIAPLDVTGWSLATPDSIAAFERNVALRGGIIKEPKSMVKKANDDTHFNSSTNASKEPLGYAVGQLTIDKSELFVLFASGLPPINTTFEDRRETQFYIDLSPPQLKNDDKTSKSTKSPDAKSDLNDLYASQQGNSGKILARRKKTSNPRFPWCKSKTLYHFKIAVGGHDYDNVSPQLAALRRSLPDWVAPTSWIASYLQQSFYIKCDGESVTLQSSQ